jgi:tetratricopeptide (TPR) repeat protein
VAKIGWLGHAEGLRVHTNRIEPYRLIFGVSLGLYAACFLVGTSHVLLRQGRLPSIELNPLAEGDAYERAGQLNRAIREYRMVARIDRGDYESVKRFAAAAQRAGDPSGLVDQLLRARSIWPRDPATHIGLAWAYYNNRRFDEAEASFRDALRLDGSRTEAQAGIGETLLEQNRLAEAIAAFQVAARMEPTRAATYNSLGIAYALSGARRDALSSFDTAVRLDPQRQYAENRARAQKELSAEGKP